MPPTARLRLVCLMLVVSLVPVIAHAKVVASSGDAYVSQNADSGRSWSIGSSGIAMTVSVDAGAGLRIASIVNPATGTEWVRVSQPDTHVVVGASSSVPGAVGSPFQFSSAATSTSPTSVTLALTFSASSLGLRAIRNYVCYVTSPVVETWTVIQSTSARSRTVENLNSWELAVKGSSLRWITGLQPILMGSDADAFTLQQKTLAAGETFTLGAQGRSSESAMPYFVLESGAEQLFGGIEWSGAWSLGASGAAGGTNLALGLPAMVTTVHASEALEMPHGFFGITAGSLASSAAALRTFVNEGLRAGRPFPALVTANTWFTHGVAIDEDSTKSEMDASASIGAELYVVDAGYYPSGSSANAFDFTAGLGTWTWDAGRFPSGLPALAQAAHDRGLLFGLWVEPERVAMSTVGQPGLAQSEYLAMQDGRYDPDAAPSDSTSAQICLASPAARAWVLQRLTALIDAVHPDYLKWDNNFWINCNRTTHGHDASDGNFRHVQGLYSVLAALHQQYPSLLIENCSGGGHRLDFGMLRYTDVGWMDDRTSPAPHVRHNLEGLLTAMPPAYLFSFVLDTDPNPVDGSNDIALTFRSRMPGVLGLGFSAASASDAARSEAAREVSTYKALRDIQAGANGAPLTAQALSATEPSWDVVEESDPGTGNAVIFAFQADDAARRTLVQPVGLVADATYEVVSADAGPLGTGTGAALMSQGVEIDSSALTGAHILTFRTTEGGSASSGQPAAVSRPVEGW